MNPLKTITIAGTNNKYSIPVLDINDNVNIDLPEESGSGSGGISSAELENHNSSSTAHEDIRAEINELSTAINGAIVTVSVDGWAVQEDGTYTNTIVVDGVTADTTYDVNLYGDYTDEQAIAFGELITSIATGDGQVMVTASEAVTVELQLLLRGKIDFTNQSVVYVKDLKASRMSYDNTSSGLAATDVQGAVDEVDNKLDSFIIKTFKSDTVTIAALGSTNVTIENIMADGYRFVFAVPGWANGTNYFLAIGCVPFPQDNKVEMSIRNFYNSGEATGSYTIVALFIKE